MEYKSVHEERKLSESPRPSSFTTSMGAMETHIWQCVKRKKHFCKHCEDTFWK